MADSSDKKKKKLNIMQIETALYGMELKLDDLYSEIDRQKERIEKQKESLDQNKSEYEDMD